MAGNRIQFVEDNPLSEAFHGILATLILFVLIAFVATITIITWPIRVVYSLVAKRP